MSRPCSGGSQLIPNPFPTGQNIDALVLHTMRVKFKVIEKVERGKAKEEGYCKQFSESETAMWRHHSLNCLPLKPWPLKGQSETYYLQDPSIERIQEAVSMPSQ